MQVNSDSFSGLTRCSILLVMLLIAASPTSAQTDTAAQREAQDAFWNAAQSGDVDALTRAENDGADVEGLDLRRSENGRRALNWAAWFNHVEAIEKLIDLGAEIDGINLTGYTPIHHAAENGSVDAARLLIEAGADIDLASFDAAQRVEEGRSRTKYSLRIK